MQVSPLAGNSAEPAMLVNVPKLVTAYYTDVLRRPSNGLRSARRGIVDLGNVLDMDAIRGARISIAVDLLGGAGVRYWPAIAERYGLNLTVVNDAVDPTFRFINAVDALAPTRSRNGPRRRKDPERAEPRAG